MSNRKWVEYFDGIAKCETAKASYKINGFKSKYIVKLIRKAVRESIDKCNRVSSIVDIGCGDGSVTCSYTKKTTVYGCDGSKEMLKRARHKGLIPINIDFNSLEKTELPISNHSCIVLCECLVCANNPLYVVDYLCKLVISRDSNLIISIPNSYSLARRIANFLSREKLNYTSQEELDQVLRNRELKFEKKYIAPSILISVCNAAPKRVKNALLARISFNIVYSVTPIQKPDFTI